MHRVARVVALLSAVAPARAAVAAVAQGQALAAADRAPRFYLASAGSRVLKDASDVAALGRRVSVALRRVPLGDALEAISAKAELRLVYSRELLPRGATVSLKADGITVTAALTEVLLDTGLDVVISPTGQMTLVRRGGAVPQGGTIVGRVTDANTGRALADVEVLLDGTPRRAVTDTSGRYRLSDVDPGAYALVARRLGYARQSRKVTVVAEREDTVDVVLEPRAVPLDELITTATGRQRRRDLGNAITTIRADSVLKSAPIRNLTDLLDGRVPGLTVRHTTGAPGDPAKLRLRGLGSITRSNDPIVIVDGVRVYATQSEARSGNLTNFGDRDAIGTDQRVGGMSSPASSPAPSPLDQIDPNIIEKVEIFKGPSAATLYGADAANGVIVITTKRGKPGPTRWSVGVTHGRTSSPGRWPEGYYQWGRMEVAPAGPTFCTVFDGLCVRDSLVRYQALNDPAVSVLGQGRTTGLSLTASGGTQALTYSLTGSYGDETGLLELPPLAAEAFEARFRRTLPDWMRRPQRYKTWSLTSNFTARLGRDADVTLSTTVGRSDQQRSTLENEVPYLAGTYVDKVNGIYRRAMPGTLGLVEAAPISGVLGRYYNRTTAATTKFTAGLNANWRPRSWFTASGQAGLDVMPREDRLLRPGGLIAAEDSGAIVMGLGRSLVSSVNVQGALRKPLRWGFAFEANLGANLQTTGTTDLVSSATGLRPGTSAITGATRITATDGRTSNSVFGYYLESRVVGQRLSLSTGIRLDGGSAYGARLGGLLGLPKFNGSWVISEEPFFPFKSLFSSLRLRGAYGQAQVQPGPADRLRLYDQSVALTALGNTRLRPERSTELEGGVDADLWDSRVSVELTWYQKTQVDALLPVALPGSVNGGGTVLTNVGTVRNRGLELTLGLTPVRSPSATWAAQLNFSQNRNRILKLGHGVTPNPAAGLVAGYPVGARWDLPIVGFVDRDGSRVIEPEEIQVGSEPVFLGSLYPDYNTSLQSSLALFGGAVGVTAMLTYDAGATQTDRTAVENYVLARALVDRDAPSSEQAAVVAYYFNGRALPDGSQFDGTEYGVTQSVSTLRFHSLSVRYRAPARVARLIGADLLSVSLQGSNLGLHSSYRGKDPDVNAWSAGEGVEDSGQLPQPRTWQVRFDVEY